MITRTINDIAKAKKTELGKDLRPSHGTLGNFQDGTQ